MKQPALMAPRTLAAVSDEVATDAPIMTPIKLVQATDVHVRDWMSYESNRQNKKIIELRSCLWRTQYIEHKALQPSAACLRNDGNITKLLHFKNVHPFIQTSMTEQQSKKVSLGALPIMLQGHITHLRNFVNYDSCKHCNSWGKF